MYSRYVDDVFCVLGGGPIEILDGKELWSQVQQIANSIHESIQVTFDYPENIDDVRMAVLDLKVWMGKTDDVVKKKK